MICGSLKNATVLNSYGLLPLYDLIRQALAHDNGSNIGRVDLVDGLVYANFDVGTTEVEANRKFEYHHDYLDVHVILKGAEKIGYRNTFLDQNDVCVPFDESRDLGFLQSCPAGACYVALKEGDFAVFAPLELHQPLCAFEKPAPIRKMVLKVHADYLKSMDNKR